ncbi:MAG: hypothetical protein ATN31_09580, partial [Candidatus Epulonipiscioides saccharophilum]
MVIHGELGGGFIETYLGITIPAIYLQYEMASPIEKDFKIICEVPGNVFGTGGENIIKLIGKLTDIKEYYESMYILIENLDKSIQFQLYECSFGFKPSIELINFSGELYEDILLKIDPEPERDEQCSSNKILGVYIYSFNSGSLKKIFDSQTFNYSFDGVVLYENNYKVQVVMKTGNSFILDVKDSQNLNQIYQGSGRIIGTRFGQVMALGKIEF